MKETIILGLCLLTLSPISLELYHKTIQSVHLLKIPPVPYHLQHKPSVGLTIVGSALNPQRIIIGDDKVFRIVNVK